MRLSRLFTTTAFTIFFLLLSMQASAQNPGIIVDGLPGCDFATGRLEARCIPVFIGHLVQLVFGVISVFFILNVMYAGYQIAFGYITGEKAQGIDRLRWSIIGLGVSICSFLILNLAVSIVAP